MLMVNKSTYNFLQGPEYEKESYDEEQHQEKENPWLSRPHGHSGREAGTQ
jgi:hypothetical protein